MERRRRQQRREFVTRLAVAAFFITLHILLAAWAYPKLIRKWEQQRRERKRRQP
jgi:hypothetical protein